MVRMTLRKACSIHVSHPSGRPRLSDAPFHISEDVPKSLGNDEKYELMKETVAVKV